MIRTFDYRGRQGPDESWLNDCLAELGGSARLVAIISVNEDRIYRCVFDTRGMVVAVNPGGLA
jgi:hypothetical protein